MTLTEERVEPDHPAAGADRADLSVKGGVRLVWFLGGFLVALNLVVLIGLGVLAVRSDGDDIRRARNEPVATGGPEQVFVATEFAFDPAAATAPDGQLTITLDNRGAIFHNLLIEGAPGFVLEADAGGVTSAPIDLDDGVFTVFCSVPGHLEAGMVATLTVGAS